MAEKQVKFTHNGFEFVREESSTEYAKAKGFPDMNIFLATELKNNFKEYVLFRGNNPIFHSQRLEDVACHVDWIKLVESADMNPGLAQSVEIVEAGVDPNHQTDHCDYCKKEFVAPDEGIKTCTHKEHVTLCEKCYKKAGNSVR